MKEKKKVNKKTVVSVVAAALAVILLAGAGTFAYLSDNSDSAINTFAYEEDHIWLDETTGDTYNIVPGTWERKDPTVSWDADVDSYVFIFVHECNPSVDGSDDPALIYQIDPSWTQLDVSSLDHDTLKYIRELFGIDYDGDMTWGANGNTKIYYRLADETGSSSILLNNQVSYNDAITEEMVEAWEEEGLNIHLIFGSYIIQQDGFNDALSALLQITTEPLETMLSDISDDGSAVLTGSVSMDNDGFSSLRDAINGYDGNEVTIDLNDFTMYISDVTTTFTDSENLTIENGYIVEQSLDTSYSNNYWMMVGNDSSLTLKDVEISCSSAMGIFAYTSNATLTIENCAITSTGVNIISTSHSSQGSTPTGSGNKIVITNSTLTVSDEGGVGEVREDYGIMVNGGTDLEITGSTISADCQAVVVREGNATITDSALVTHGAYSEDYYDAFFGSWSGGNAFPVAALVVGSNQTSGTAGFAGYATAALSNVTLVSDKSSVPMIHVANGNDSNATVVSGANDTDTITCDYIAANGPVVNGTKITQQITAPVQVGTLGN